MNKTIVQFDKLIFSRAKPVERLINVFPIEPTADLEKKLGKLIILTNYPATPECQNFIKSTIDFLRSNYYQTSTDLFFDSDQIEERFEALLQKVNQWLQTELRSKNLLKLFPSIDLVVVVLYQSKLYFSQIGRAVAYLIQDKKITNLSSEIVSETAEEKSSQFFSNIVSGNLEINDNLLFCFKNLLDYFSLEKIKQIVNRCSPTEAVGYLNKILSESGTQINTGLVIFKSLAGRDLVKEPQTILPVEPLPTQPIVTPAKQIETTKEERALQIMPAEQKGKVKLISKPKLILKINKILRGNLIKVKNIFSKFYGKIKNVSYLNLIKKIGCFLKWLVKQIYYLIKRIIQISKIDRLIKIIWHKLREKINRPINKFNRLPYLNRSLLVVCLIFGLLFLQSLIVLGRKEIKARQEKNYLQIMEEVRDKKNTLSAALIYGDQSKAKSLLKEIDLLLNRLPPKLAKTREEVKLIQEQIKTEQDKLYSLIPLEEPNLLFDFSSLDPAIQLKNLIKSGDSLYSFNPANNYVYEYDLATKKSSLANQTSVNVGFLKKMIYYDTDFLLGYADQNLAFFNLIDKNFNPIEIKFEHKNPQIEDLAVYQGKIYILDRLANQIYKYSKTISGFGQEQTWLEEKNLNLKDGVSLTIDASIYLLKEDGGVLKFYKGLKQNFNLSEVRPKLVKPDKIFTRLESKYLYLLDPGSRRLIIFDKNGQLKKQLFSEKFDNLNDFVVGEKEDKVWILNGTKIFEIKLK